MMYRELYVLQQLSRHLHNHCTTRLLDAFVNSEAYEDPEKLDTLYLVTNFVESNLETKFKEANQWSYLTIKTILYNLLVCLKFIHSAGLIHRDLTPPNVLIGPDNKVQLCDFGWCRGCDDTINTKTNFRQRRMSKIVSHRFYRSPENILLSVNYTQKADIWSFGCIAAEMLKHKVENSSDQTNKALFQGDSCYPQSPCPDSDKNTTISTNDQLLQILKVIDIDDHNIDNIPKFGSKYLCEMSYQSRLTHRSSIEDELDGAPRDLLDFVSACLKFDPK